MAELRGLRAVVTGASRGIGAHIAGALAGSGVDLVLVARTEASLRVVAERAGSLGVRAVPVPADLADPTAPRWIMDQATAALGGVDLLVNNAALDGLGRFEQTEVDALQRAVQVNLTAALVLSRLAVPGMLDRGSGHLVNVASLMGKAAAPYHAAYSATKFGMVGMTQALRLELADRGVRFSVVCPGLVRDEGMYARIDHSAGRRAQRWLGTTTPQSVASAVVRAISEDRSEVLVTPKPMRPLLALGALFPRLQERLVPALGVTKMYRHAADSQDGGPPSADAPHSAAG